jgi:hypothetical protein
MQEQLMVKMVLDAWNQYIKRTDDLINELSDDQLKIQVAPGRNTGVYLSGHLTAVHDRMIPLLGFGQQKYPDLYEPFVTKPDGDQVNAFPVADLRRFGKEVNDALKNYFTQLSPAQWFEKHSAVSEEDFKKEPHRNKLNLIINRTNHLASHYGQLVYLKPRNL